VHSTPKREREGERDEGLNRGEGEGGGNLGQIFLSSTFAPIFMLSFLPLLFSFSFF